MRTQDLECFVAVARSKNMTVAMEELQVSQPTISKCMKRLRTELRQELYVPTSDGAITLTDAGVRLLSYAQEVVTLTRELQHQSTTPLRIRLGLNETAAQLWFGECLGSLRREFPHVAFDLKVGTTDELGAMIRQGALDLAIGTRGFDGKRIAELKLKPLKLVFAGQPPATPKPEYTLAELAARGLITFQAGSTPYNALSATLQLAGIRGARVDAISSIAVMLQLVEAGGGIATLPQLLIERLQTPRVVSLPCEEPLPPLKLWLSWRTKPEKTSADEPSSELVPRVVEHVKAYLTRAYA